MMMVRWKIFRFHAQILQEKQREISPCGKCFATLDVIVHPQRKRSRDM